MEKQLFKPGSPQELELLHEQVRQLCMRLPVMDLTSLHPSEDYDCADVVATLNMLADGYRIKIMRPLKASLALTLARSVTNSLSRHVVSCRPHRHPDVVTAMFSTATSLCTMPCVCSELQCTLARAMVQTLVLMTAFVSTDSESAVAILVSAQGADAEEEKEDEEADTLDLTPEDWDEPMPPNDSSEPMTPAQRRRKAHVRGRAKSDLSRMIWEAEVEAQALVADPVMHEELLSPKATSKVSSQEACLDDIRLCLMFYMRGHTVVCLDNWKSKIFTLDDFEAEVLDFDGYEKTLAPVMAEDLYTPLCTPMTTPVCTPNPSSVDTSPHRVSYPVDDPEDL